MHRLIAALCLIPLPAFAEAPPPLTIQITWSDKALAEMVERGEMITVAAYWMGGPGETNDLPLNEEGSLFLQSQDVTIWPGPQSVTIGQNLGNAPLDKADQPMVNVNVFSARFTDKYNLLDCDFIDAPVAEVTSPQTIHCKLIDE